MPKTSFRVRDRVPVDTHTEINTENIEANVPPFEAEAEATQNDNVAVEMDGVDIDLEARKMALRAGIEGVGMIIYNTTHVDSARMDDISAPLAEVWAPLLPAVSPATQAIMVTIMLVLPKMLLISNELKRRRVDGTREPVAAVSDTHTADVDGVKNEQL